MRNWLHVFGATVFLANVVAYPLRAACRRMWLQTCGELKMKLEAPLTLCCVALLAGCMGSSKPPEPPITRYQSLVNSGNSLVEKWVDTNTTPENMPSGTFSYSGVAAFSTTPTINTTEILDSAILVADFDMDVDFDQSRITGELSNFVNDRDHTLSGSVPLSGSFADAITFTLSGEATALVSSNDNSRSNLENLQALGSFYGQNANAAIGFGSASYGGTGVAVGLVAER